MNPSGVIPTPAGTGGDDSPNTTANSGESKMATDEEEGVAPCPDCDGGRDDNNETCERCCGNGEIVVDWDRYLRTTPNTEERRP